MSDVEEIPLHDDDCSDNSVYDNDDDDDITLPDLMQSFFASESGTNIVDTLLSIKKSFDTQNKILHKISVSLESIVLK